MKNLKDLKPNEAIRVDRSQWQPIVELMKKAGTMHPDQYDGFNPIEDDKREVVIYGSGGWDWYYKHHADALYPASDFLQAEPQYEIGSEYEFQTSDGGAWNKGTLLGIIDHKCKYIASCGDNWPYPYENIRPIQPRSITRWINVRESGQVLRKSYESAEEAKEKAMQGGMMDCKQVELKGVITP